MRLPGVAGRSGVTRAQRRLCARYGVPPVAAPGHLTVGLARGFATGPWPLNGLRHPPAGDTTGWYLWAGEEWSDDDHFFEPTHTRHLAALRPEVLSYLALPPGGRFLIAPGYEDVWHDPALLDR